MNSGGWDYFQTLSAKIQYADGTTGAAQFRDFKSDHVEHVISCTEIASGSPVYFTSAWKGRIIIRLPPEAGTHDHWYEVRGCAETHVASAVFSSAAFPPYLPPRRFTRGSFGEQIKKAPNREPSWPLLLSDGGIWSNIATQSLDEDHVYQGMPGQRFKPAVVLVANASAAPTQTSRWPLRIPILAFIHLALRAAVIQGDNTVGPRIAHLRKELAERLKVDAEAQPWSPLVASIELGLQPIEVCQEYTRASISMQSRRAQPAVDDDGTGYHAEVAALDLNAMRALADRYDDLERSIVGRARGRVAPWFCRPGVSIRQLASIPTGLRRIRKQQAMLLILRGYANAHLNAYGLRLTDQSEPLMDLGRLDRLVSKPDPSA